MTKLLTAIERGAEDLFRRLVVEGDGKRGRRSSRTSQQLTLKSVANSGKRKVGKRGSKRQRGAWRRDPVIAPLFEPLPDGRIALWINHRLRTPQDSELSNWRAKAAERDRLAGNVYPMLTYLRGVRASSIVEVWFIQVAPPGKTFFDNDNLNPACKAAQDAVARHFKTDDASHVRGSIRWRHGWLRSERDYGLMILFMGAPVNGQWDRVVDGHVTIERRDGSYMRINMRDEFRDTA